MQTDIAQSVRHYIADHYFLSRDIVHDELDLYVDLHYFDTEYFSYRDISQELLEGLSERFEFDFDERFNFDRHFPELDYPGMDREMTSSLLLGCLVGAMLPVIFLLKSIAYFLFRLGVPARYLGADYAPPSDRLPPPLPVALLPANYSPLTVGQIVRAAQTGILTVNDDAVS